MNKKNEVGTKVVGTVNKNMMCLIYSFDESDVRLAMIELLSYMYSQEPEIEEF